MKYFTVKPKLDKEAKKELNKGLTALDEAILRRAKGGEDIIGLLGCGKPFINEWGRKEFASTDRIQTHILKLMKLKLLVRR